MMRKGTGFGLFSSFFSVLLVEHSTYHTQAAGAKGIGKAVCTCGNDVASLDKRILPLDSVRGSKHRLGR